MLIIFNWKKNGKLDTKNGLMSDKYGNNNIVWRTEFLF